MSNMYMGIFIIIYDKRGDTMFKRLVLLLTIFLLLFSLTLTAWARSAFLVKEGMRGEQVRQVQTLLITKGFLNGEADGICGSQTVEAIKKFQLSAGLEADGICGDETYALLNGRSAVAVNSGSDTEPGSGALKPGMSGNRVRALQELLFKHGYLLTEPDGIYGTLTEHAVINFQRDTGLTVDGICGSETIARLQNRQAVHGDDSSSAVLREQSSYAAPGSVIKPGMHGDGVTLLQEYLIDFGYLSGHADGLYGPQSVAALKRFQADNGLEADGICGSATYAAFSMSPQTTAPVPPPAPIPSDQIRGRLIHVYATAYSPMDPGLSLYTATGKFLRRGIIAVDPAFIPLGTHVYIPGYGEATADDIGGSIHGNHIDIAFDTHEEALNFGHQSLDIYLLDE